MAQEYKGYKLENNNFSNVIIKPVGKGSVPLQLRGMYTSSLVARESVDQYLLSKSTKKA